MATQFFGTDGIRGIVGHSVISPLFMKRLGRVAALVYRDLDAHAVPRVVVGRDTRASGVELCRALVEGLVEMGARVYDLGIAPTPVVAYLVARHQFDAGIVVSASHNSHHYNGVKFFDARGYKLGRLGEESIERALASSRCDTAQSTVPPGGTVEAGYLIADYINWYREWCQRASICKKIVVDCAHGAFFEIAPRILSEIVPNAIYLHVQPNGCNINEGCGSLQPQVLQEAVRDHQADFGFAFDGDGDRVIVVDRCGIARDGDTILSVIGHQLQKNKLLTGLVGTVMTNVGLEKYCRRCNIPFFRSQVGDKYVLEMMLQQTCNLGGETSGHIICLNEHISGDGLYSAIKFLHAVDASSEHFDEICRQITLYPMAMRNIVMHDRYQWENQKNIQEALYLWRTRLGEDGRIVLRMSGTESMLRVMVEARDLQMVRVCMEDLVSVIYACVA